jgi:hypothetical protein
MDTIVGRHRRCSFLPSVAPQIRQGEFDRMKKVLLCRDLLIGITVIIGLPLLMRHERGLLIFACLFVGIIVLPRVLASAWGLIDEVLADRTASQLAERVGEKK